MLEWREKWIKIAEEWKAAPSYEELNAVEEAVLAKLEAKPILSKRVPSDAWRSAQEARFIGNLQGVNPDEIATMMAEMTDRGLDEVKEEDIKVDVIKEGKLKVIFINAKKRLFHWVMMCNVLQLMACTVILLVCRG